MFLCSAEEFNTLLPRLLQLLLPAKDSTVQGCSKMLEGGSNRLFRRIDRPDRGRRASVRALAAKAPEAGRSPKPDGQVHGPGGREASWTAVALYRFSSGSVRKAHPSQWILEHPLLHHSKGADFPSHVL
jgi:hypothetical protein